MSARHLASAKALVAVRDGRSCRRCGLPHLTEAEAGIHDRLPGGGTTECASALVTLCEACRRWVATHPEDALVLGYLLTRDTSPFDPAQIPLFTIDGWMLLDDNGDLQSCAPPRRELA